MPRPRKIAQEESKISEVVEVQDEVTITEVEVPTVELEVSEPEVFAVEEISSPTVFKVYHLGPTEKEQRAARPFFCI